MALSSWPRRVREGVNLEALLDRMAMKDVRSSAGLQEVRRGVRGSGESGEKIAVLRVSLSVL